MSVIRICRYCGAKFDAPKGARICPDCREGAGVSHPSKYAGIKESYPSSVWKGSGYGKECESEKTISAVCKEYDPTRGESPFDYGKISARLGR